MVITGHTHTQRHWVVYLAGKYNAPTDGERLFNTDRVIDVAIELYERSGHKIYPVIPHLTHYIEKRMDYKKMPPRPNEFWYEFDNIIIPKCDALFMLEKPGVSKGADAEVELARRLGIPVYYDIEELLFGWESHEII